MLHESNVPFVCDKYGLKQSKAFFYCKQLQLTHSRLGSCHLHNEVNDRWGWEPEKSFMLGGGGDTSQATVDKHVTVDR